MTTTANAHRVKTQKVRDMARQGFRRAEIAAALNISSSTLYNIAIANEISGPNFRREIYQSDRDAARRARAACLRQKAACKPEPEAPSATADLPPDLVAALAGVPNGRGEYRWINQIAERFGLTTAQVQLRLFRVRAS